MPVSRPATACAKNGQRAGIGQQHDDTPARPVIDVSFDERPPNEQQKLMQQLQTRVGVLQQAMKGKRIAEHHVRSCELRVKKVKFADLAEPTKIGPIGNDIATDRVEKHSKMIDDMLAVHEGSFMPCDETTYHGFLAIFDLSRKLIRDKDDDNLAVAMFRSRLEELEKDVRSSHEARMLHEGRTLATLLSCPEVMSDMSDSGLSEISTLPGKSRSPSPMSPQGNKNRNRATGARRSGPNFDPRTRTAASASRGQQSIQNRPPNKVTDMEDMFESDTESACSQCSQRGKCPAQDGVCDGPKVEEVD